MINNDQFSHGQISSDDKGDLKMLVAADHGTNVVRIQFDKPIMWLALSVSSTEAFARLLEEKADELKAGPLECEHEFETYAEASADGDGPDMTTAYRKCKHCSIIEPIAP